MTTGHTANGSANEQCPGAVTIARFLQDYGRKSRLKVDKQRLYLAQTWHCPLELKDLQYRCRAGDRAVREQSRCSLRERNMGVCNQCHGM